MAKSNMVVTIDADVKPALKSIKKLDRALHPRSLTRTALRILFLFLVTIEFIMGFFVAIAEHISDATTAIQQSLNETNPTTESKDEPPGSTP